MLAKLATVSLALMAAVAGQQPFPARASTSLLADTALPECAPMPITSRYASGKRGLAYNDPTLCSQFKSDQISWRYNWGSSDSNQADDGLEFVSMLWGTDGFATWKENAELSIKSGTKHLVA
jgi:hypothetical protein